jgi:2-polyprenyl-3-methyl-5-hydroxy-6-metoxy-1,4-benzoquinol methylase
MSEPNAQERHYRESVDYSVGSPHLSHPQLYDRLVSLLLDAIDEATRDGLPRTVLEAGAGHGGYTEPVLATGAEVLAVEMSRHSVAELERRFGSNPLFRAAHSPNGVLSDVQGTYTVAMAVAVLHHIPDYLSFLRELAYKVTPGGSLITLQDPLWYPRNRLAHRVDTASFLAWRLAQGNLRRGLATRLR